MPIITFKYKDTIISTPNLEKKLKRMKLSLNDIEIIDTPIKKEKIIQEDTPYEIIKIISSLDNRIFKSIVSTGHRPNIIDKYRENPLWLWNDNGQYIKETLSEDYIKTLYYLN